MDDILNAPLWQKILAAVLIVGFVIWGYYNYLYLPKVRDISSLKSTLWTVEREIEMVTPSDTIVKDGAEIKELIQKEIEELMKKIPTEQEVPFIIDELISRVGDGLNIDYRVIQPLPIVAEGKYKRLPLKISFVSDYTDLNLYIRQLKNIPATVRIDNFSLDKTADPPKLLANMTMSVFIMPVTSPAVKEEKPLPGKPYLFDPFFKPSEVAPTETKRKKSIIELQGIWKGKELKAVINDKLLKVGDSVLGYEVIQIKENEVTLLKGGKRSTLKLKGGK